MNPQNPIALANQQQMQQPNQQQPTTNPIQLAQQQSSQQEQQIQQEGALGQQNQQNALAAASKAMATLNPQANSKDATSNTMSKVGQAISTPAYAGYCQKFVDDQTGATQRYPTAAATWQAKVQSGQAKTDLNNMKPGDVVEFAPDSGNGNMGHAALVLPGGKLKMATNSGVETYSLKDWISYSGQVPEGFYSPSK